jgi:hypothetical protein
VKWSLDAAQPDAGTHRWGAVATAAGPLSFADVAAGWAESARFREFWIGALRTVPIAAYCWECPPQHVHSQRAPFECVFVASPSLARMPQEPEAFAGHFRGDRDVAGFANLGGDAWLVAPAPERAEADFAHLAAFTATASAARQDALWQAVGAALKARVGARPLWLSTAGHGVAWLHVRLDSRPKYYRHAAYRDGWRHGG